MMHALTSTPSSTLPNKQAFRTKAGSVHIFRPHANSARINLSARAASMPTIPQELFLDALRKAVAGNIEFVPPYGP